MGNGLQSGMLGGGAVVRGELSLRTTLMTKFPDRQRKTRRNQQERNTKERRENMTKSKDFYLRNQICEGDELPEWTLRISRQNQKFFSFGLPSHSTSNCVHQGVKDQFLVEIFLRKLVQSGVAGINGGVPGGVVGEHPRLSGEENGLKTIKNTKKRNQRVITRDYPRL